MLCAAAKVSGFVAQKGDEASLAELRASLEKESDSNAKRAAVEAIHDIRKGARLPPRCFVIASLRVLGVDVKSAAANAIGTIAQKGDENIGAIAQKGDEASLAALHASPEKDGDRNGRMAAVEDTSSVILSTLATGERDDIGLRMRMVIGLSRLPRPDVDGHGRGRG